MKQKNTSARLITGMIICVMMLFGMAGCGSSGGEQTTEETTVETTAEAAESSAEEMLTESEALENALDVEGLYVDDVEEISVQLNTDDGAAEYDIAYQYEGVHYEYAVDAYTGDVYEYE